MAIVEADDEAVVNGFGINDPAIKADLGSRFEVFPYAPAYLEREELPLSVNICVLERELFYDDDFAVCRDWWTNETFE